MFKKYGKGKNEDKEKEEVLNLCKEFIDYENSLNYDHKHQECSCFLIEKNTIDTFKKKIFYDELKEYIKNGNSLDKIFYY